MSRTRKGNKGAGWEVWSRRPGDSKEETKCAERMQSKEEVLLGLKQLQNEEDWNNAAIYWKTEFEDRHKYAMKEILIDLYIDTYEKEVSTYNG